MLIKLTAPQKTVFIIVESNDMATEKRGHSEYIDRQVKKDSNLHNNDVVVCAIPRNPVFVVFDLLNIKNNVSFMILFSTRYD